MKQKLLNSFETPAFTLNNRVVMAPMNRRRAIDGILPTSSIIYYAQRASAGLIITDNTAVTPNGTGYLHSPGIYNKAQIRAWQQVADAVHAQNGKIFMQLVHAGRIGHYLNYAGATPLVAPSAVKAAGTMRTPGDIYLPMPTPVPLTITEIQELVKAHIKAAENAITAGFDGVEIHGAHGLLADQFLNPRTNQRTDRYGGSIANRSRFLLEIVEGVAVAIGKERTGVRLSPFAAINDLLPYPDEKDLHQYLADALQNLEILYIHLSDLTLPEQRSIPEEFVQDLRRRFQNLLILAGGFTADSAEAALQSGLADLIAFGKPFIANPDLVKRFQFNLPLSTGDQTTYYQGGDQGYIDYPAFKHQTEPCKATF